MTTIGPVRIRAVSFFSTHHASAADALADRERAVTPPAFALLVGRARRFTSLVTQLHMEVCGAVQPAAGSPPIGVFATCHGEIQTAERLIADFRDAAVVSSARFALSVHNTPSGVYSIATGSSAPSTTITGANAIAAGWLEAALTALDTRQVVLLSIADESVPAVLQGPAEPAGCAAAFLLEPEGPAGPGPGAGRRARLTLAPAPDAAPPDTRRTLAHAADAAQRAGPAAVALGPLGPGAALQLELFAEDAPP